MESFTSIKLEESLKNSLTKMNFIKPTPIQGMAIPVALEGRDILGTAQTGTGKTLAFSVPLINKLILDKNAFALVMCPTRELATQVMDAIKSIISDKINIRTALLIGGESMQKQLRQLGNRSRIIVGTPGRINDHLKRKSLKLKQFNFLVLDETDRMLDMGFITDIKTIISHLPTHQTLLFSATLPKKISEMAQKFLNHPERISVGETNLPTINILQEIRKINQSEKFEQLKLELLERTGSVILFVKTKRSADKIARQLRSDKFNAEAIHGDLRQSRRDKVMMKFRKNVFQILVATDVAARGLDIPLIEHVINYDIPQNPEDYIHRIGRTARAGAKGKALTFITPADKKNWGLVEKLINPDGPQEKKKSNPKNSRRAKAKKSFRKFRKKTKQSR